MTQERLQKIIAQAGIASRRAAEALITQGRVRVNGRVASELGMRVDGSSDRIEVDGRRLVAESPVYLVLHKPRAVVSTVHDPEGRTTVRELLKGVSERVFPVGRLDFHTSGVLLLTNDGAFCDGLLHPRKHVPKTYIVKVSGEMREAQVEHWARGVELEDGKTRPAEVKLLRHEGRKTWLEVTLLEGRNQQIRRMGEATGFPVMRLSRVAFGSITAIGLRPGQWRPLVLEELTALREAYGVPKRLPKAPRREAPRGQGHGHAHGKTAGVGRSKPSPRKLSRGRALTGASSLRTRKSGG